MAIFDFLRSKKKAELSVIAASVGLGTDPKETKESMIERIQLVTNNIQNQKQARDQTPEPEERVEEPKLLAKEMERERPLVNKMVATPTFDDATDAQKQVMTALSKHIALGLVVHFDDEHDTWQFSFGQRTDSGTLKQPLSRIVKCADVIVRTI